MHPDLDDFLEAAFQSVRPTSPRIGRVVVEPDYESSPEDQDAEPLARELIEAIKAQTETAELNSREGQAIEVPGQYKVLSKYVRRIVLHADTVEGSWVEVEPPGNWI